MRVPITLSGPITRVRTPCQPCRAIARLQICCTAIAQSGVFNEGFQTTAASPGGHGAAQLIGFARAEAGRHHGQLNDLFLEDRHTEGALEHTSHRFAGITDRFQTLPSS